MSDHAETAFEITSEAMAAHPDLQEREFLDAMRRIYKYLDLSGDRRGIFVAVSVEKRDSERKLFYRDIRAVKV
jgi:hypothetical protein